MCDWVWGIKYALLIIFNTKGKISPPAGGKQQTVRRIAVVKGAQKLFKSEDICALQFEFIVNDEMTADPVHEFLRKHLHGVLYCFIDGFNWLADDFAERIEY